ncbi:MAG: TonB-dependent receptor [Candidatus Solibacter usitatus]|nr:TonB-dependent receptor [Candidatus Solibacter usitatus]
MRHLLALFAFLLPLTAQLDTGSILGTLLDSSGAVITKGTITVTNQSTAASVQLTTSEHGNFIAPVLTTGIYRVAASAPGFKTQVKENLTLRVSDRMKVDFILEPGSVSESVTVSDAQPLVDTASTTLGGVVGRDQIDSLPVNGRDLTQLLTLIPGAVLLGGATQQSVNGSSTFRSEGGVHFLMDGGDASRVDFDSLNNTYGASRNRITRASVDAVQEFRVYASSYSAEFGQAMGGVVNLITRSGSNKYHGGLFEYLRNEKLDTRNYFNRAVKPPFRLNQFGGTLGGPIVRDKLFFFGNYEGLRQRLGVTQTTFVPTADFRSTLPAALRVPMDMLPLPNGGVSANDPRLALFSRNVSNALTENAGAIKVDWRLSPSDSIAVRYNLNNSLTRSYFGVARGQIQGIPGRLQNAKLTYTKVLTPRLLNESGFTFNRMHIDPRSSDDDEVRNFPITAIGSGVPGVGPNTFDLLVANNSFSLLDSLSWSKGRHQFKFGGQIIRNQDNKELRYQRTVTFQRLEDFLANSPFSVSTLGQPRAGMRNTYFNFFAQDDVQVSRNLTLNTGLRYQFDTSPSESHGRISNFNPGTASLDPVGTQLLNPPTTNFAPRFGFAWSPRASRGTVVRGGFGIFYASLNAAMAQNVPNNISQQASSLTRQQFPALTGFPFPQIGNFASVTSFTALERDWNTAYTEQWNFNLQQALPFRAMFQVGYIGNRALHLTGPRNLNRLFPGTNRRPYPQFGNITLSRNDINANYNALQASFRKRMSRGMTFNVNYTWSHTLDEGGISFGTAAQDDQNRHEGYGNSDHDARHMLQFDYSWMLPKAPLLPKWVGTGWQVNGMTVMRGGFPVNVTCGCDSMQIGTANARADLVPGVAVRPEVMDIPSAQYNLAAFRAPRTGTFGNAGRNILRGPAAFNWDFSLFKSFRVREAQAVQFRAEMFNFFNTPQFGLPGASLNAPAGFGRSLGTISTLSGFGTNRQIQFALRWNF